VALHPSLAAVVGLAAAVVVWRILAAALAVAVVAYSLAQAVLLAQGQ
tara:strand:- start:624 stop:764 length:141 start_codon:yes stop_codon:yes gene_type:complete